MNQRVTLLVLGILMLSYSPPMGHGDEIQMDGSEELPSGFERVEISPDPNSIRDLGEPTVHDGLEDVRQVIADTVIGIYTESGLIPRLSMDSGIAIPRSDLVLALMCQRPVTTCFAKRQLPAYFLQLNQILKNSALSSHQR